MKLASKVVAPLVVIASMVLATAVPAQAAVVPTLIRDNPAQNEYAPAATASYFAWSDAGFGRVYGMSRAGGGAVFGVSATSGPGFSSSPVTGGADQIIYQQTNSTQTKANLYIFNLASKVRSALPKKVNSIYWEYSAVASTQYILFDRLQGTWRYMLLYNRSTHALSQIAKFKSNCPWCFRPTWVGATHAVYDKCSRAGACDPQVRTFGGSTVAIPIAPAPVSAYGGSLDEATGNLYFIKSSLYCGIFVSIERANIASPGVQTDIYDTPVGIDLGSTSLAPDIATPGDIDLLFSEFDCMAVDSGIYEIDHINAL